MDTRWHLATNMDEWLVQALAWVRRAEAAALARHDRFDIVLAGGGTPRLLYQALAQEPHAWEKWRIWLGDERCLPPTDPERNSLMARASLAVGSLLTDAQLQAIPAELGPVAAAQAYGQRLAGVGAFDLVLLGLGEDGHTASLFPGHDWGTDDDAADALPVFNAPKPPPERVSLSAQRLGKAEQVLFLVTGAGKREAVSRWQAGDPIPASAIRPACGVDVLLTAESHPSGVPS